MDKYSGQKLIGEGNRLNRVWVVFIFKTDPVVCLRNARNVLQKNNKMHENAAILKSTLLQMCLKVDGM